jgi:hypothetical protein
MLSTCIGLSLFAPRRRNFFIKSLRQAAAQRSLESFVFGFDSDELDPFALECDEFEILESIQSESGEQRARTILQIPNRLCFGWNDQDILALSAMRNEIHPTSALAHPSHSVVLLMSNKILSKEWAKSLGVEVPKLVCVKSDSGEQIRAVVKPVNGQGSVGLTFCDTHNMIKAAVQSATSEILVEEYIDGIEYTVDVVCYNGELINAVPRKRLKVRGGEVVVAQVEMNRQIIEIARRLCAALAESMVFNFQVIATGGKLFFIEMNPRFGGGSDLTIAAGVDLAGAYIDMFYLKRAPSPALQIKDRLIMTRRLESTFLMPTNE